MNLESVSRVLALLSFLSFGLTLWRWAVASRFPLHRRSPIAPPNSPFVLPGCTLLKPLKGCDAETASCLRTWLTQTYPGPTQILFGAASASDPVCALVRGLLAEFPQTDAQLVICEQEMGVNKKVSTLRQLEPLVRHPLVVISDADVRAPADLLANLAPLFGDAEVGLVNCFYRLANPAGAAMRWEAIAINADFWCSVLQAQSLKKVDFALGAVMALPRAQLQAMGGFAPLADFLADDYQLGRSVAGLGKRVVFSPVVVDCHEPPMNWAQVWAHQVRWARTIRACQPLPVFFSILDNATFWPLLWLLVSAGRWFSNLSPISRISPICLLFFVFRIATALQQEKRMNGAAANFRWFWMVPVKDLLNMVVWVAAFTGSHIQWRGRRYRILSGGRLKQED